MNRRIRSPSAKAAERLHRFLRPGALARLRDSRIRPRSVLKALAAAAAAVAGPSPPSRLSPPSSPATSPPDAPQAAFLDGSPCFAIRSYGPRFPQRKKLLASKSIVFFPAPVVPGVEPSDSLLDSFGVDLLVAH